jgi:ankyrin repeat protein
MNLPPPPPQHDNPTITQFKPVYDSQWDLSDENIKRIDPRTGRTILHNYCKYINTTPLEVYRYLIETKGCDVNVQDKDKDTPVHFALRCFDQNDGGNITVLTYLLSHNNINANVMGKYGNTLLHAACFEINTLTLDIFKLLIERLGCDVNAQDDNKDTPFHYALHHFHQYSGGDINILKYLLNQKGVNGNIKGWNGYTILHTACNNIKYLPLDVFRLLIETMGCDVNAQANNNDTPIYQALRYFDPNDGGDINVLMYLLSQKGINGNIKGWNGYTLLYRACININKIPLDVFKLLVETIGCDVNVRDNDDGTPIHHTLRYFNPDDGGDINVFAYLINQKDVNVNINGKKGYNLLHLTCISNLPHSALSQKPNGECDTILCQIVEVIAERCIQQVLDENNME